MKPIKVEFLNKPKVEPITQYKKPWWLLWLLFASYPRYRLIEDMNVRITFDNGLEVLVIIEAGYICDLASVPRLFWFIYPPDGAYRYAAILHDILYQSEYFTRILADKIFIFAMKQDIPEDVKAIFYKSVRLGGDSVWKTHTKDSIKEAEKYLCVQILKKGKS